MTNHGFKIPSAHHSYHVLAVYHTIIHHVFRVRLISPLIICGELKCGLFQQTLLELHSSQFNKTSCICFARTDTQYMKIQYGWIVSLGFKSSHSKFILKFRRFWEFRNFIVIDGCNDHSLAPSLIQGCLRDHFQNSVSYTY